MDREIEASAPMAPKDEPSVSGTGGPATGTGRGRQGKQQGGSDNGRSDASDVEGAPSEAAAATGGPEGGTPPRRRRRRSRGGRGRGRAGARPAGAGSGSEARADPADAAEPAVEVNDAKIDTDGKGDDAKTEGGGDAGKAGSSTRSRLPSGTSSSRARRSPRATGRAATEQGTAADGTATSDRTAPEEAELEGNVSSAGDGSAQTGAGAPRRRRRRGGRGRGRKPATAASATEGETAVDDSARADEETVVGEAAVADTPATQRDDALPDADLVATTPARRRRRTSTATKAPAEGTSGKAEAEAPTKPGRKAKTPEEQVASGGPTRGLRSTRTRTGGRETTRRRRELAPTPPRITGKVMVITEHGDRDQIAVLEEDVLVQHYVTRTGATSMVGNIYLGRVQNVLPGMEAAFVDVGRGRNGVLYAGEVNYSPEDLDGPAPRIEQVLKPGQGVMVQVTKDPMGGKGARLTANLSLAGRFLVLAPNQNLSGISRRLGDNERRRLKAILRKVKPPEHGVIVRTAAEKASDDELTTDLQRLLNIWNDIQKTAKKVKAPAVLYEEPELTVRVVRDLFTDEEFKSLVTDSPRVHEKVMEYVREVAPDLAEKVHLHTGPLPAFEEHRIVEQIHKALDKKVWLPSGGYLFIERTEAMTIIDVNTGKSVGKTNLEETVVNTNLEAAREAARQLRLRDIGGIIVIDFIDMLLDKNKRQVEDTMREALALDKTRSQVFEIGPLGLMQVTRKRVSSGLVESFSETCPTCEGRGIILNYDVS